MQSHDWGSASYNLSRRKGDGNTKRKSKLVRAVFQLYIIFIRMAYIVSVKCTLLGYTTDISEKPLHIKTLVKRWKSKISALKPGPSTDHC